MRGILLQLGIVIAAIAAQHAYGGYCPEGEPAYPQDMYERGGDVDIFSDLNVEEMQGVLDYMYKRSGIRIASWEAGSLNDSWIYLVEALPPRKVEALNYLDRDGRKPARYAKVILYRGDLASPHIEEYEVGPVPRPRGHRLMINPAYRYNTPRQDYRNGLGTGRNTTGIPWHMRSPFAAHEQKLWDRWIKKFCTGEIEELLMQATEGYSFDRRCKQRRKCLKWMIHAPGQWLPKAHKVWVSFYKDLEGFWLHPVGFQFEVNAINMDPRYWTIDHVWWRGVDYIDLDLFLFDLRRRVLAVDIMRDPFDVNTTSMYSTANFRVYLPRWYRYAPKGPRTFLPDGRRYIVNENRIEWQGWEFHFGVRPITGLHLNNIIFRKERIIYELALMEILLVQSGKAPVAFHSSIFDTMFNIGRNTYSLMPGLDCPHHATYFDTVQYIGGKPYVFTDAVCVFEHINAVPLRRHYQTNGKGGYEWFQGMDDNVLIIRTVTTIRSHGYMVDIVFHQNGGVDVRCSLTGYIMSSYYSIKEYRHREDDNEMFGFPVFPDGMGHIQHHLINFKVDIDILGLNNRVETLNIRSKKMADESELAREYLYNTYFERIVRRNEMEAATVFDQTSPKYMLFSNFQKTNRLGAPRAYRVQVDQSALVLPGLDWKLFNAASWAKYHVSVTKQNDSEQTSTSVYSGMDPFDPVVHFQNYVENNDRIEDEDLVAWVTLGTIHIPHTEDVPLINTQGNQLMFHITPYNYFDEDPSLMSRDNLRITPDWYGNHYYNYSGVYPWVTCTPRSGDGTAISFSAHLLAAALVVTLWTAALRRL